MTSKNLTTKIQESLDQKTALILVFDAIQGGRVREMSSRKLIRMLCEFFFEVRLGWCVFAQNSVTSKREYFCDFSFFNPIFIANYLSKIREFSVPQKVDKQRSTLFVWGRVNVDTTAMFRLLCEIFIWIALSGISAFQVEASVASAEKHENASQGLRLAVNAKPGPTVIQDCTDCPAMIAVPVTANGRETILLVGRYELKWQEYLVSVDQNNCPAPRDVNEKIIDTSRKNLRDDFPMTSIRPDDMACYLSWIRKKTGKQYRLPSEREWIAIARAASGKTALKAKDLPENMAYLLGRLHDESRAVADDPRGAVRNKTVWHVGRFPPDRAGLYDLFGNALEATSDRESVSLARNSDQQNIKIQKVIAKGGDISWGTESDKDFDLINQSRKLIASAYSNSLGFRLIYGGVEQ